MEKIQESLLNCVWWEMLLFVLAVFGDNCDSLDYNQCQQARHPPPQSAGLVLLTSIILLSDNYGSVSFPAISWAILSQYLVISS